MANFTEREISKLEELAELIINDGYSVKYATGRYSNKKNANIGYFIQIYKKVDEWFYATILKNSIQSYYKCDQFEGLIKLMEYLNENDNLC